MDTGDPNTSRSEQSEHSGNKYIRTIRSRYNSGDNPFCRVDVYCVLKAFAVTCPALQHVIKKLLCAGIRGKADCITDLKEARDALDRAIEMQQEGQ